MRCRSKPWKELSLPSELTRMRAMLSHEEKQYLTWLTAEKFEGWGAIVDLGPWLGSSSAALAEGLKRKGRDESVMSFDLFRWDRTSMEPSAQENLRDGADFLPVFMREIGPYAPWIQPQKCDLLHYCWDGGPIEILFVDAAKSWELLNSILIGFGDALVPGQSRVVLQDFRFYGTHWLPLVFDSRPDLWKEVESVEEGTTVTFMLLKELLGPAGIHSDYSDDAFPVQSAEYLLRSRIAREIPANRNLILAILYRKFLADGTPEEARRIREELLADRGGSLTRDELAKIEDLTLIFVLRGWAAYGRQDWDTARTLAERSLTRERSVYAVALLGLSLLRLGDFVGAKNCIGELMIRQPGSPEPRLYRAELSLAEGRVDDVEKEALEILQQNPQDEAVVEEATSLLQRVWDLSQSGNAVKVLSQLVDGLSQSPAFLLHFARQQYNDGRRDEAMQTIEKVLHLAPDHHFATTLRKEWRIQ